MIIMLLIGWIISLIEDKMLEKRRAAVRAAYPIRNYKSGYHINPALWERSRGCNATGKYNDIW